MTDRARWLESHLAEVVSRLPADAGPDAVPRLEYEPAATSLRQREIAKAAELRLAGHDVALRTLQRLRRSYETDGVWGLVGHLASRVRGLAAVRSVASCGALGSALTSGRVGRGEACRFAPDDAARGHGRPWHSLWAGLENAWQAVLGRHPYMVVISCGRAAERPAVGSVPDLVSEFADDLDVLRTAARDGSVSQRFLPALHGPL